MSWPLNQLTPSGTGEAQKYRLICLECDWRTEAWDDIEGACPTHGPGPIRSLSRSQPWPDGGTR